MRAFTPRRGSADIQSHGHGRREPSRWTDLAARTRRTHLRNSGIICERHKCGAQDGPCTHRQVCDSAHPRWRFVCANRRHAVHVPSPIGVRYTGSEQTHVRVSTKRAREPAAGRAAAPRHLGVRCYLRQERRARPSVDAQSMSIGHVDKDPASRECRTEQLAITAPAVSLSPSCAAVWPNTKSAGRLRPTGERAFPRGSFVRV